MTGRRRTHLLLVLVLAMCALAASGAYVAFGPSARTAPATFTGVGHGQADGGLAAKASPRPHHPTRPQQSVSGHGAGVVPVSGHDHGTAPTKTFGVRVGRATGLYPGSRVPLPVSFSNPNSFALGVTRIVVDGGGSGACSSRYFVNRTYVLANPVHVAPHRSVKTTVPFGMKKSAPDACQAVHFTVDVTATAVRS